MFDLKCKRQGCEYNKNCNCTAKKVEVSKNTICNTYEASEDAAPQEEKIGQPPIRKDIKVGCKANCLFNTDGKCIANGITVQSTTLNSTEKQPTCCTFQPK